MRLQSSCEKMPDGPMGLGMTTVIPSERSERRESSRIMTGHTVGQLLSGFFSVVTRKLCNFTLYGFDSAWSLKIRTFGLRNSASFGFFHKS